MANRVLVRPETLGQRPVDHCHRSTVQVILVGEGASPKKWNLHGVEVTRLYEQKIGRGLASRRRCRLALNLKRRAQSSKLSEREIVDAAYRFHPWHLANALEQLGVVNGKIALRAVVTLVEAAEPGYQDVVGVEA